MKKTIALILTCLFSLTLLSQTRWSGLDANTKAQKFIKKGQKYLKSGDLARAKKSFDAALEKSDKSFQALGYLAVVADMEQDFPKSLELFEKSIKLFDEYKAYVVEQKTEYLKKMELEYQTERYDMGRNTENVKDNSENPALMQQDLNENRVKQIKQQIEEDKARKYSAFFYFKYGNVLMKTNQFEKGLQAFELAKESDPEFKDTYANLAVAYFNIGDCEKALATYESGKKLGTQFHPAFKKALFDKCKQ